MMVRELQNKFRDCDSDMHERKFARCFAFVKFCNRLVAAC